MVMFVTWNEDDDRLKRILLKGIVGFGVPLWGSTKKI